MAATAQKQWTLSEHESSTTLEAWKTNLMQSLSTEEAFSPFLQPNATWKKKTKKDPLRGFTGPDASEKTTILELMLLRITGFAPVLSRQTIVKNSTSLNYIWEALELYYGIDNCHDPNICLSQSSTPHQPSHRSHSEPSQTTLLEIETSQAPKDAKERSESAPLHQDTQLSPSEPSLTAIPEEETSQAPQHVSEQSKSAPLLHDTQKSPSTAVDLINQHESLNVQDTTSHGQPTQESTGEAGDPQTLATFSRPLAKSCIQRDLPEHFPGNHVSRPDYSLLSSGPVFADSCELDHPSYPVNPSPQPDHLVQHFSGDWHSAKSLQQLAISTATFCTLSKPQSDTIDACSAKWTHTDVKTRDRDTLSDVQDELLYSVDASHKAALEHTFLNSHVDKVSCKPEPNMDSIKTYATDPDVEMPLNLKDMQLELLKEELELLKDDNAYLQKTKATATEEMKEELRKAYEERVELERRYIAIIGRMKQEWKKMEHETQMIINLKNTELLKLKEEISSLQQTKLVTANTDVTFHKTPNTDPVKSKKRASQSTQVTEMQKLDDESKDCKNENHDTDQQVQKGGMSEDPHESLNTLNYIGKLTRKDTTEMDGVDSPSKKPDHDIVKTKRCYRCRDDRHLIRDCTVGPKTWARYSRMQPCHICKKTGHKATNCWFRNQKPGEKRCFRCDSSKHIVKNCTLPRPTNASLAVEENHACSAQGDGMHMYDRYDWYRTHEERIRILVTDIIHESLQCYGVSFPEGSS